MNIKKMLKSIKKINKMNYDYAQFMKILLIQQKNTHQYIYELENENERLHSEIGGIMEEMEEKEKQINQQKTELISHRYSSRN